jgi:hypothetical protein
MVHVAGRRFDDGIYTGACLSIFQNTAMAVFFYECLPPLEKKVVLVAFYFL